MKNSLLSLLAIILLLMSILMVPISNFCSLDSNDPQEVTDVNISAFSSSGSKYIEPEQILMPKVTNLTVDNFEDGDPTTNSLGFWTGNGNSTVINEDIPDNGSKVHKVQWNVWGWWATRLNSDLDLDGLNATNFNYLTFDIRGGVGGESYHIILEDIPDGSVDVKNDTEFTAVNISDYINISKNWTTVYIPLYDFIYQSENGMPWYHLDVSRLKGLKFIFDIIDNGTIFFDNISFISTTVLIDNFSDIYLGKNSLNFTTNSVNCEGDIDISGSHKITWNNTNAVWYTKLWNDSTPLNLTKFMLTHLLFKVKGTIAGVDFKIALNDTSSNIRFIKFSNYYNITEDWQRLCLPLTLFTKQGLNISRLTELSFHFNESVKGSIFIDDLYFIFSRSEYVNKKISMGNIKFIGNKLFVNGTEYKIKGVGYQPIPIGEEPGGWNPGYSELQSIFERDFKLLSKMHCNSIRTWNRVDKWIPTGGNKYLLLDTAEKYGIKVIAGFWIDYKENFYLEANRTSIINEFKNYVTNFSNHSSILMWGLGNEQNLRNGNNMEYYDLGNQLAYEAYLIEGSSYHPIGIINYDTGNIGTLPKRANDEFLDYLDFWGANAYYEDFTEFFDEYRMLSTKPIYIAEYGADALDNATGLENETAQAEWNMRNWDQINNATGCVGATVMSFLDEWWKFKEIDTSDDWTHDKFSNYPTPKQPDGFANEEWFGLVRTQDNGSGIDKGTPRKVYYAYQKKWNTPPYVEDLSIDPLSPRSNNNLTANYVWKDFDNIDIEIGTEICWYKNGELQPSLNGSKLVPNSSTSVGDEWYFTVRPSDGIEFGELNSSLSVIIENTRPKITTPNNTTAIEDEYFEVIYDYEDLDEVYGGQSLFWKFETDALWLQFNLTTGILNGTPDNYDVGVYWVNITINDTVEIDFVNYSILVNNVNDAPEIITPLNLTPIEDVYYELVFNAIDVDNLVLYWSITTNASWLNVNQTISLVNGTPTNDDACCEFWVNVTVSDGVLVDNENYTLYVKNVNDFPRIIPPTPIFPDAVEDQLYMLDFDAVDDDPTNDVLTWHLTTDAGWLSLDQTGVLSGTPTNNNATFTYNVNITLSDGNGASSTIRFDLYVNNVNDAPTITTTDITIAIEDERYQANYQAIDIDPTNDKLTWTSLTNADWLSFNETSASLFGTPTNDDVGEYWVKINVSDGKVGFDEHNFTLTVVNVNDAPVIAGAPAYLELSHQDHPDLDLEPYVTDVDTPISNLTAQTSSDYIIVDGLVLSFNYDFFDPTRENVTINVTDGDLVSNDHYLEVVVIIIEPWNVSVVDYSPKGSNVSVNTNITVKFNTQMNEAVTENAFSISPSVTGTFTWDYDILIFNPANPLEYLTEYTVTITTDATDISGWPLNQDHVWSFTTAPPPDLDTDGDGYPDVDDAFLTDSRYHADTDGDGMADAWEDKYSLDKNDSSDKYLDPDEDGKSNYDEFLDDSNPRDEVEEDEKEGENDWMLWVAIIIILIIVAILALAMMRRKPVTGAPPEEAPEEDKKKKDDEE